MALTVTFVEFNGSETPGSNVGTEATNINLGSVDSVDLVPASNAILKGAFSFGKFGKFNFSGSMTQVDNVRLYKSSGVYKTEEVAEFSGSVAMSVPDATDQTYDSVPIAKPDSWNVLLPSGQADGDGGTLLQADSISTPGYTSGSRTNLVGFQLSTTANTETGATNQKVFSLVYDTQ